ILEKEEQLKIHPKDASLFGVKDGDLVRVASRRGELEARVLVTDRCPQGMVSMTFHFAETPTNVLTSCELDPVAKTPETKVCAIRIERIKGAEPTTEVSHVPDLKKEQQASR
ncbi:MAG: molybdopterin dinucleotide binding domain-containing protein, partial [Thermodesulfobacteriota bacterium]